MAERAVQTGGETRWSVAAVARALGVAPATLRTWDRRYGVGPSGHREGQHRRYTEADLRRLETMRRLLLQGVSTAHAAQAATTAHHEDGAPPEVPAPRVASPALGRPERSRPANVTVRQLREAALRMDADRVVAMLTRAVDEHGVTAVWERLVRPALTGIGDRWTDDVGCIAAEHLLSECTTRVLHQAMGGRVRRSRPVLLVCAPGEAHVLPLHALAAALAERSVPSRLLGAATPAGATTAAARRLQPSAVVVWAQSPETADPEVFTGLPPARGGRLLVAAGPGWALTPLPAAVARVDSLPASLGLLAGDLPEAGTPGGGSGRP